MLFRFLVFVLILLPAFDLQAQHENPDYDLLIKNAIAGVQKHHIDPPAIDETFCKRWFERYISDLDPKRLYFLETDIEEFRAFVRKLPELASSGKEGFYVMVTKRYQKRLKSATDVAIKLLDYDFNYSIDEEIQLAYKSSPKSDKDRNERWRLQVKYNLLVEKSGGSTLRESKSFLKSRYESLQKQASEIDRERSVEIYLDAFCRTIDPHSGYWSETRYNSFGNRRGKYYSIGLRIHYTKGRAEIRGITPGFVTKTEAAFVLGCELLAIRAKSGKVHNMREINPMVCTNLVGFGLGRDEFVILELYDETRLRRFNIKWPRK